MSNPYILYVDHQGHPAPLTECFHATASRRLSSTVDNRYPPSSLTEVDSAYCPQCLSFHDAASAARLRVCSKPTCQRCPICVTAVATISAQNSVCCFQCGQCEWTSRECGLTVPLEGEEISKLELTRAAEELGLELNRRRNTDPEVLLDDYFTKLRDDWDKHSQVDGKHSKPTKLFSSKSGSVQSWSFETLEASLETKRNEIYHPVAAEDTPSEGSTKTGFAVRRLALDGAAETIPSLDESLATVSLYAFHWQAMPLSVDKRQEFLPLPTPLRARRSRRCRAELAEGRPGILLKPKLNPLEGDSSLRTGHGQWWRKDSSAIHVIPRVRVLKQVPVAEHMVFLIKVVNPTLGTVRLRFAASPYGGEPEWDDVTKTTTALPGLLVDTMTQECLDVQLDTATLATLPETEVVELLSAEDSIIEMGGKARGIPDAVTNWDAAQATGEAKMTVVAHCASDAWFQLVFPMPKLAEVSARPGFPFRLQVELGNGSWESSLISPLPGRDTDWIEFDLVLVWN